MSFQDLSVSASKRTAAGSFLELLQLKTLGLVDLKQSAPFSDIDILPSVRLDLAVCSSVCMNGWMDCV